MHYDRVITDYNNNTLDKNKVQLVMDNDGGYWQHVYNPELSDDENDNLADSVAAEMEKRYGLPNGYADIVDILVAAGVPCEWC